MLEPSRKLYYDLVEKVMGFPRYREFDAAARVAKSYGFECLALESIRELIRDSRTCVVGPLAQGAPLRLCRRSGAVVVLDSSFYKALEYGLDPGLVVGDGDYGFTGVDPCLTTDSRERFYLLHVHGDNYMYSWGPIRCSGRVLFTSQAFCMYPVLGVGGFTDGDRALILGMALGAESIVAWGFDFERVYCKPARYCFSRDKKLKLGIARLLVEEASRLYGYKISRGDGYMVLSRI